MATNSTKSLSRRFGLKHVLKVVNESRVMFSEDLKNLYLNYQFNGKSKDEKFEVYSFSVKDKNFNVKRSMKNGVLYLSGVFGSFKADDVDNVIVSALRSIALSN